jgi:nucleotide-binding universal stress UspA family protein
MANVLIPVDFSVPSHNAYRYGLHLAKELGRNVVLVHFYSGSIDPRASLYIGGDGTIQGSFEERLRQFAYPSNDGVDYPLVEPPVGVEIRYETDVTLDAAAAIVRRAHQPDIDWVVMAPRNKKGLLNKWLGSTSTTVSESCDRPVFIIPPHARYRTPERMVVANNHGTADPYPLWQLNDLARHYRAKVHFVHVEPPEKDLPLRFVPYDLSEHLIDEDRRVDYAFEIVSVEDRDVSQGLLDYADGVKANLLVIVNRRRSRWAALLKATLTQDLALRSRIPVLILHGSHDE